MRQIVGYANLMEAISISTCFGPRTMRNHIYTEQHCQNSSSFDEYLEFFLKRRLHLPLFTRFLALKLSREFPDVALEQNSVDTFWSLFPRLPPAQSFWPNFILTVPRRYFCCSSLLLLVLAVRIYTLVQLLC